MPMLAQPEHQGGGGRRGFVIVLLAVLVGVAIAVALWLLARRPAEIPKGPPPAPRARTSPAARATPAAPEVRATPRAEPGGGGPTLRVEADVPGANVFLDRKFVGTTPVETSGFAPGPHRLNVSAEGHEMYGETVELGSGPSEVFVRFKQVRLDERVAVAHRHGIGSCRGLLRATTSGLRYEADKAGDAFEAPFASLEPLQLDYMAKNLRVRLSGGKTYNFTSESADALLVFQKAVEAARKRL